MITIVSRLALLLYLFFYSIGGNAQSVTFSFNYSTEFDDIPIAAMETSTGDFIVVGRQAVFPPALNLDKVLFLKLSPEGDSIKSSILSSPGGNCYINTLIPDSNGQFFGVGCSRQSPDEVSLWLIKMDDDLNLSWEEYYKTNCQYMGVVQGFRNSFSEILIYGNGDTGTATSYDLFICKTTLDGDSVSLQFYPDEGGEVAWTMNEDENSGRYYFLNTGRYIVNTNTWGQILTIGYDMNVDSIVGIPGRLIHYYNLLMINEDLLITGIKSLPSQQPYSAMNLLGIEKLDTNFSIVKADSLGSTHSDTLTYPGYITNIDTGLNERIWCGGTFRQDNNNIFSNFDSWILLACYDYDLNIKWQKFYGGDLYYGLWGVKATSDGGCLLLCTTYDDQTQFEERDILIMKVDSNGVITGDNSPTIESQEAIIFPNPSTEYLNAVIGAQYKEATLYLYDTQGKIVFVKILRDPQTRINTASLSVGAYIYKYVAKGKVIGSGKLVKQ